MDWYYTLSAFLAVFTTIGGLAGTLWSRLGSIEREAMQIKLDMAQAYVTNAALSRVEERLERAIERLGDRLEQIMKRD